MKSKTLQIALRLALIIEEFSEKEIIEAIKLMEEQGVSSNLISYLNTQNTRSASVKSASRKKKLSEEQLSQFVIELEKKDPEKYHLLSELEFSLKNEKLMGNFNEISSFTKEIINDLLTKSSRADIIKILMIILVDLPLKTIEKIKNNATNYSKNQSNEYQQLADFIIKGESNQNFESD